MMNKRTFKINKASGFSLIEALVALAVFSFGVLAIAKFQGTIVSSSSLSKTRSEAVQLAQQKIDEIRQYTTEPELVANLLAKATPVATDRFLTVLPDGTTVSSLPTVTTTYPAVAEPLEGNNADFTRQWDVACVVDICSLVVRVQWTDQNSDLDGNGNPLPQEVALNTQITWKNPRGSADLTVNNFSPLVPSATGRAHLGNGTVSSLSGGTDHGDGTVKIEAVNGTTNVALVDTTQNGDGTYNIVLTLEDACQISGGVATCTNFVKISGRVYIESGFPSANAFVLASDAAYCARVNAATPIGTDTDADNDGTLDGDGDGVSDYTYFDYTCYLGGGWHGNIGLLLSGKANSDHVCLGDPDASVVSGLDAWKRVELASRRVYRGMTYKVIDGTTVVDGNDNILYYSQGIADATVLPDPAWTADLLATPPLEGRTHGHDYVVTSFTGNPVTTDCLPKLQKPDAVAAGLFVGVATDFVCLNEDKQPLAWPYLDTLGDDFRAPDYCPYDPSRGPALVHHVTGTVSLTAGTGTLDSVSIESSSAAGNCTFDGTGLTSASYDCKIYDWGTGWTGFIEIYYNANTLVCDPALEFATEVTTDQPGNNFSCQALAATTIGGVVSAAEQNLLGSTVIATRSDGLAVDCTPGSTSGALFEYSCPVVEETLGGGWTGRVELTLPADSTIDCAITFRDYPYAGQPADLSTENFDCLPPEITHTFAGQVRAASGVDLTGTTLNVLTTSADTSGSCIINTATSDSTVVNYDCTVTRRLASGWTGEISINAPSGVTCTPNPNLVTVVDDNTSLVESECVNNLDGPVYLRGTITVGDNLAELTGLTISATQTAGPVAPAPATQLCTPTTFVAAADGDSTTYICTVDQLPEGTTWTIRANATSNKVICVGTGIGGSSVTYSRTGVTPNGLTGVSMTLNVRLEKLALNCP